jgi:putative DNA primase/helicase
LARKIDCFVRSLNLPTRADDAVKRLARTFGLIAAAGQLASELKVIPVPADEMAAGVRKCFLDWLASRGGARSKTGATALIALRDYIARNLGRFVPTHEVKNSQQSMIAGYRKESNGDGVFYLPIATWKEVLASAPRAKLVEELDKLGLLIRQGKSKDDTIVKKLSGGINVRVYAVSARILEVREDGTLAEHDDRDTNADADDAASDADNVIDIETHARRFAKTVRASSR